jgi:hypothetical protein
MSPCTLRNTYQIIRNVLAACVASNGTVDSNHSHALIIYDAANPAFQEGGFAREQLTAARADLKVPDLLRSVSWQSLVDHLESSGEMLWLIENLKAKYGF